jgi:DNA modification methylase
MTDSYLDFLNAKVTVAPSYGFEVDPGEINPARKDFIREAIVPWAARGGRRAIFSSFGLHKTSAQIELARLARIKTGALPLIVVPLGVRHEFIDEAAIRFTGPHAVTLKFIRTTDQIEAEDLSDGSDEYRQPVVPRIYLTNYESVREGKIDTGLFGFVSLDEAAVLRGFAGTKTFREFMRVFAAVRYRFVATATPDPNEFIELLAYAAYLGIMDVGEAKTRFFKRDSSNADKLTIHPHKEKEFWLWVASWALFVRRPSDLGFSDDGYILPKLDIRWHEVPSDHSQAGADRDGQGRMFRNAAIGIGDAAKEKRISLPARIAKLQEIRGDDPQAHRILWHDLEAERAAIEKAVPGARSIFGAQDLEINERNAVDFKYGRFQELATKPVMSGAGCNFQMHCAWAIFLGIGHKFHDFIQAVHRLQRFGQTHDVRLDLIYTDAEREIRRNLEAKWARHELQAETMARIIREYGLAEAALSTALQRSIGVERQEASGERWRAIHNDSVIETQSMPENSVDLIVTSIPFATQYEYTPSYNDFGHTDDNDHFWRQMDFLTPELLRVLKPGRDMAIHVKDRIVPSGMTGLGFQVVHPFHAEAIFHFRRHGFGFLGMRQITTDVVRENNQTYRLGWTEQCKDGTKMGAGLPEYLLLFRKPPTDRSNGYADEPVVKQKPLCDDHGAPAPFDKVTNWKKPIPGTGYSRARWQMDAHSYWRSSGDRLISAAELATLIKHTKREDLHKTLYRLWRERSTAAVYDHEAHIALAEEIDHAELLPATFMLLPPHSPDPNVWTDITRMRTLNGAQHAAGREMHLCPMQLDLVERLIIQHSMEGEIVFDPFMGIGTVPSLAVDLKRRGLGVELSEGYWKDAVHFCRAAEAKGSIPSLFDLLQIEHQAEEAAE